MAEDLLHETVPRRHAAGDGEMAENVTREADHAQQGAPAIEVRSRRVRVKAV